MSDASGGSVVIDGSDVKFTPTDNLCGLDVASFDYTVSDTIDTDTGTVTIDLTCVNDPPVANAQSPTFLEDSLNNLVTLTGSTGPANESGQALTFWLTTLPANGTLSQTSGGAAISTVPVALDDATLYFTPSANYCTTGNSFNFYVKDNGGIANSGDDTSPAATVSVTITCVNDEPVLGTFPANAGGQYTDPVDADTTTAGIQSISLSATDVDNLASKLSFFIDSSKCSGGEALPKDLVLTDNGDGTATISGRLNVKSGTYYPCIVVSDSEAQASAKLTITVTPEDATIVDIMPTFVQVDGTDGNIDTVTLTAKFVEVNDGFPSSTLTTNATAYAETNVKFALTPIGSGVNNKTCTDFGVPTPSGSAVTCNVADLTSDVYEIDADILGRWFVGDGIGTLAVFDPANGFATGGGNFTWANGPAPWTDAKVNFGFTGKKVNKNVKGSVLTVIHSAVGPYVIKTNAFTGLAVNKTAGGVWYTSMTGKATYSVPEGQVNPYCSPGVLKCGNFTIVMYAEDRAEPGAGVDQYKLKLIAPNNKVVFDMTLQTIAGGNVQIPHATVK